MMVPSSSTAAPNINQPVNNNFWASLNSVQEGSPVDWPLSVFPLAQQQFYQEFNQQQQKKRQQRQHKQQMKGQQNRRNNKIHPTNSSTKQEMLPHSESLNFNSFGHHRKSGRSFSNQDLTKLGRETSAAKCLNAIQEQHQTTTNMPNGLICPFPDPQLGLPGGVATSSADSFISACSVRRPSGANAAHSPNNSNGGGTGSSHSTAPIFIASNQIHQPPFHPFNQINSQHHSPVGTNNYQSYSISQLHKIHTRRTTSLEERSSLLLTAAPGGASSDDDTLFTTPSNSFNRLGGQITADQQDRQRRSPSPQSNSNNNSSSHPSAIAINSKVDFDQRKRKKPHSIDRIGSIPAVGSLQSSQQSDTSTTIPANTMISPSQSLLFKQQQQMQRNNSSGSLASSSALLLQTRMNSFAGSIPNGINQNAGGAKRSFSGIGNGPQQQQFIQQFYPQFFQQQFIQNSNNPGGRSSLLYAAALNNIQQQQQNQPPQNQSASNFNNNVPTPQQECCAESVAGESNISAGLASGGIGSGESGNSPKSSKKKQRSKSIRSKGGFEPQQLEPLQKHRGELSLNEKYHYDLSRAQLKASSRTSALLSGFAMIALVELQYMPDTPKPLLIMLGVVTTLLVSVHLLALMMSTCLLPYIEANGCTRDSPHIKLKFYIELSWIFSTCIGLLLFLLEIGVIFFVKFNAIGYNFAAYITTGMLVPVLIIFIVISYLIHRNRFTHSIERVNDKVVDLQKYLVEAEVGVANQTTMMQPQSSNSIHRNMVNAGLQGVTVVRNFKD